MERYFVCVPDKYTRLDAPSNASGDAENDAAPREESGDSR